MKAPEEADRFRAWQRGCTGHDGKAGSRRISKQRSQSSKPFR